MKARVHVMLKEGVLDPQGKAIAHALGSLGFNGVRDVRQGKVIELELSRERPHAREAGGGGDVPTASRQYSDRELSDRAQGLRPATPQERCTQRGRFPFSDVLNGEWLMASPRQRRKVKRVMREYKSGQLKSGRGRRGRVTSRRQAIAIAMSESGQSRSRRRTKRRKARTR